MMNASVPGDTDSISPAHDDAVVLERQSFGPLVLEHQE